MIKPMLLLLAQSDQKHCVKALHIGGWEKKTIAKELSTFDLLFTTF